jgi:hypothetical protein
VKRHELLLKSSIPYLGNTPVRFHGAKTFVSSCFWVEIGPKLRARYSLTGPGISYKNVATEITA